MEHVPVSMHFSIFPPSNCRMLGCKLISVHIYVYIYICINDPLSHLFLGVPREASKSGKLQYFTSSATHINALYIYKYRSMEKYVQ